ncbi:UNVERIFIED_CONTAM: hypothetical protein K2H54_077230 [Gekko kuhli]
MLNAYYISHNAAACLEFRGFPWSGSPKKKKKGKGARRKLGGKKTHPLIGQLGTQVFGSVPLKSADVECCRIVAVTFHTDFPTPVSVLVAEEVSRGVLLVLAWFALPRPAEKSNGRFALQLSHDNEESFGLRFPDNACLLAPVSPALK